MLAQTFSTRFCVIPLLLTAFLATGCANTQFGQIAGQVLSTAGYGSGGTGSAENYLAIGRSIQKAATPLTEEQQYYLGRSVSASIFGKYPPYNSDGLRRYVNLVGRSVAAASERPELFKGYHFAVLNSPQINAMATPGGFIFITKGFMRLLDTEDELAAVLAHEVAHVVEGHGVAAISQSNITKAVTLIGKEVVASQVDPNLVALTDVFDESVEEVTQTLLESGYSRSQEYDADAMGYQIMVNAGYDPSAMFSVLKKLQQVEARNADDESGWMSTHPKAEDRIDELEDEIEGPVNPSKIADSRLTRFSRSVKKSSL